MVVATFLFCISWLVGVCVTYLYESRQTFIARVCVGVFIGTALWGLVGFLLASIVGRLTPFISFSAAVVTALPFFLLTIKFKKQLLLHDIHELKKNTINLSNKSIKTIVKQLGYWVFLLSIIFFSLDGAMTYHNGGIYTRSVDNYADLTLHTGIVTGFTKGNNYPPIHPDYAGTRLTYPFLADFIASQLVVFGMNMAQAFFLQNLIYMWALAGLLYFFTKEFTKNTRAAYLVPLIFFLSGGLGWVMAIGEALKNPGGIWQFLLHLPHDYSSYGEKIRWGNTLVYWFIPMRSMSLGIPIFVIIASLWWRLVSSRDFVKTPLLLTLKNIVHGEFYKKLLISSETAKTSRIMIATAFLSALLPLSHTHSYLTLFAVGCLLAILFKAYAYWLLFVIVSAFFSLPQLLWLTSESTASFGTFFGWLRGWNTAEPNVLWFWFTNTSFFIPLLLLAFVKPKFLSHLQRRFYLPFILCFIIANIVKLAPWEWDNMKVLAYWFIFSAPLVALLLVHFFEKNIWTKILASILLSTLLLSGGLDVWRVMTKSANYEVFSPTTIAIANEIEKLPARSVILTAAYHNNPVLLTGGQSFYGYPGRLWTHGIVYGPREQIVRQIYAGEVGVHELLRANTISYVLVGEMERSWANEQGITFNEAFFTQYPVVVRTPDWTLYAIE